MPASGTFQHMIRGMFSTRRISPLVGQDVTEPGYAAYSLVEVCHEPVWR